MNTAPLENWITQNTPHALEKLAVRAHMSVRQISYIRKGHVPKNPLFRRSLARSIKVSEAVLFPPAEKRAG